MDVAVAGFRIPVARHHIRVEPPFVLACLDVSGSAESSAWVVWSLDGTFVSTFMAAGAELVAVARMPVARAVSAPPGTESAELVVIVGGARARPLECWDPISGELRWRRADLTIENEGFLARGTAGGRAVVRVQGRSTPGFAADVWSGLDAPLRDFAPSTAAVFQSPSALPPTFRPEPPPSPLRLPACLRRQSDSTSERDAPPSRELYEHLRELLHIPATRIDMTRLSRRKLEPSMPVLRTLARLHLASGAQGLQRSIRLEEAQWIALRLGRVADDLLCAYAMRAELAPAGWSFDSQEVEAVGAARAWRSIERLRPIAVHRDGRVIAAYADFNETLLAEVTSDRVRGPEPLVSWLARASEPIVGTFVATSRSVDPLVDLVFFAGAPPRTPPPPA